MEVSLLLNVTIQMQYYTSLTVTTSDNCARLLKGAQRDGSSFVTEHEKTGLCAQNIPVQILLGITFCVYAMTKFVSFTKFLMLFC